MASLFCFSSLLHLADGTGERTRLLNCEFLPCARKTDACWCDPEQAARVEGRNDIDYGRRKDNVVEKV